MPTAQAIVVDGVSKQFRLPQERVHTLKERALHPLRRVTYERFAALSEVSFDVKRGEFFGIVGRNGSGKSTLLKCLAGIYRLDRGQIWVDGQMSTFIELGVGFNPDLPARDNVMINATMLGLTPKEARRRFDQVIDFAELHDFVDLKLKNYSSGMMVRLAFSVAIQVDAEILLIDEVLAVGDAAFQQKCFDEFGRIRERGTTVLLVTHDMSSVERFCDRAMLLEHGELVDIGDTGRVSARYLHLNFSPAARAAAHQRAAGQEADAHAVDAPAAAEPERFGDGKAELLEGWFEDEHGARVEILPPRRTASFCMRVRFHDHVEHPIFSVSIYSSSGSYVLTLSNHWLGPAGVFEPGVEAVVKITFLNVMAPDRYDASPGISHDGEGTQLMDMRLRWVPVVVAGARSTAGGLMDVPFELTIDRVAGPAATAHSA